MAMNGKIQLSQYDPLPLPIHGNFAPIHGNFAHTEITENPESL